MLKCQWRFSPNRLHSLPGAGVTHQRPDRTNAMGGKHYSVDLETEVAALTSTRAAVIDTIAWLAIWTALVCVGLHT